MTMMIQEANCSSQEGDRGTKSVFVHYGCTSTSIFCLPKAKPWLHLAVGCGCGCGWHLALIYPTCIRGKRTTTAFGVLLQNFVEARARVYFFISLVRINFQTFFDPRRPQRTNRIFPPNTRQRRNKFKEFGIRVTENWL